MNRSFRFVDEQFNDSLHELLENAGARYRVTSDGSVHYPSKNEEFIENELITQIRESVFPAWQIHSCPTDWAERYRRHMLKNNVPFREEIIDDEPCFLIPNDYLPHTWDLDEVDRETLRDIAGSGR